jgi:hypothetical protein
MFGAKHMNMRTLIARSISIAAVIVGFAGMLPAQDAAYKEALQAYLDASGAMAAYDAAIDQMIDLQKGSTQAEGLDDAFWRDARKEFKASMKDLIDLLAPVYVKHLTIEDLNGLTDFYRTPLGQKIAKETPAILQESMEAGVVWGGKIGERLARKIEERGHKH